MFKARKNSKGKVPPAASPQESGSKVVHPKDIRKKKYSAPVSQGKVVRPGKGKNGKPEIVVEGEKEVSADEKKTGSM